LMGTACGSGRIVSSWVRLEISDDGRLAPAPGSTFDEYVFGPGRITTLQQLRRGLAEQSR